MKDDTTIALLGCRTTEHGLLVRFTDGFYLFDTSFLLAQRGGMGANRIPSSSEWLRDHWKKKNGKASTEVTG